MIALMSFIPRGSCLEVRDPCLFGFETGSDWVFRVLPVARFVWPGTLHYRSEALQCTFYAALADDLQGQSATRAERASAAGGAPV
jgi:hypothetical protein